MSPSPRPLRRHLRRLVAGVIAGTFIAAGASLVPLASAPPASAATLWAGNSANPYGGTDYFIDSVAGVDTAAGTSATTPWKTLAKANVKTFAPGDRVLLKAGSTWSGQQLWPKGSGTSAKPITVDAYGDQAVGLPYIATNGAVSSPFSSGTTKNVNTVGLTGAVNLRNQQYWTIQNLELSNDDNFATDITTGNTVRDGVSVSINADLLAAGADTIMRGITVQNLKVHNIDGPNSWQRIYLAGVNFQVFGSKQFGEYATGGHHFEDVTIRDNTFSNVELNAVQFGFNWFGDAGSTVDSTGKTHENWEQLWIRDRDLYSRNVYVGHNYAENIGQGVYQFADTKNLLAEYNEGNGWLRRWTGVSAGLYLWAGADSIMRFNEIYDGPANQYDATPLDLEFTNFNVTYEYNYTHDNKGGWMSYMGNSSNSIARYNLSVNDNGVIWKNMLSTNYSPTYVTNNVFVYDGALLASVHDEVLKDTVYFTNNVFYNTSTTRSTTWAAKAGGLDKGVFSNNAYFEASGTYSATQPSGKNPVIGDPKFVGNPASYPTRAGVDNIRSSASLFKLQSTSPLIDKGRYNVRIGTKDFFGDSVYRNTAPDIGIQEYNNGAVVTNPTDTDPIESAASTRPNLAAGKTVTASTSHVSGNYPASRLVDGNKATRWAAADSVTYPVTLDVDFGAATTFDEVLLDEFVDGSTPARVGGYTLQKWDAATNAWVTFATKTDGIGRDRTVNGFGSVTTSKLRVSISGLKSGVTGTPTLTEIQVFGPQRPNLALNKTATASTSHVSGSYPASRLVDGNKATRWAAADSVTYPVTLDVDFGAATTFDEVLLDEFVDGSTPARVGGYTLQKWDAATNAWVTFATKTDGIARDRTVNGFGSVTTSKLRVSVSGLKSGVTGTPTLTEIQVFGQAAPATQPTVGPGAGVFDKNSSQSTNAFNSVAFTATASGDQLTGIRYITPAGALVGTLTASEYQAAAGTSAGTTTYTLTSAFYSSRQRGASGLLFEFASGKNVRVTVEITDTTSLVAAIADAAAEPADQSAQYAAVVQAKASAEAVLEKVNRSRAGTGNSSVTDADVASADDALRQANAAH